MPKQKKKTKLQFAAIVEAMQRINAEEAKRLSETLETIDQREAERKEEKRQALSEAYSHELDGVGDAFITFGIFLVLYGLWVGIQYCLAYLG